MRTRAARRHLAGVLEDRINQIRRLEIMTHRLHVTGYEMAALEYGIRSERLRSHCGRLGKGGAK